MNPNGLEYHMSLLERLEAIKSMRGLELFDEASAKQVLVLSVLNELGWDTYNREEVYPEYPLNDKKLDYCLKVGRNEVFVEAKRPSEDLERHEEQLLGYAFKHGVTLAILTNGLVWWFYLSMKEVKWQDRKFFAIDIRSQEITEVESNFMSFLGKEQVASGSAIEQAEKLLEGKTRVRKIQQTLPIAWREIIETPDELLVELLADKVESLCGYKPEEQSVSVFLGKLPDETAREVERQPRQRYSTVRIARHQNRDLTRFRLTIGDKVYDNLPKRRLAFFVIREAIKRGATPLGVCPAGKRWLIVPGEHDEDGLLIAAEGERDKESSTSVSRRFFTADDKLIRAEGKTYAITNQWGENTLGEVDRILEQFGLDDVSYRPVD